MAISIAMLVYQRVFPDNTNRVTVTSWSRLTWVADNPSILKTSNHRLPSSKAQKKTVPGRVPHFGTPNSLVWINKDYIIASGLCSLNDFNVSRASFIASVGVQKKLVHIKNMLVSQKKWPCHSCFLATLHISYFCHFRFELVTTLAPLSYRAVHNLGVAIYHISSRVMKNLSQWIIIIYPYSFSTKQLNIEFFVG